MARGGEGVGVAHVEEVDGLTDLTADEADDSESGEVGDEDENDCAEVDGEKTSVGTIIVGGRLGSAASWPNERIRR